MGVLPAGQWPYITPVVLVLWLVRGRCETMAIRRGQWACLEVRRRCRCWTMGVSPNWKLTSVKTATGTCAWLPAFGVTVREDTTILSTACDGHEPIVPSLYLGPMPYGADPVRPHGLLSFAIVGLSVPCHRRTPIGAPGGLPTLWATTYADRSWQSELADHGLVWWPSRGRPCLAPARYLGRRRWAWADVAGPGPGLG